MIDIVYIERDALGYPMTGRAFKALPKAEHVIIDSWEVDVLSVSEFQRFMTEYMTGEDHKDVMFTEKMEHIPGWVNVVPYAILIVIVLVFIFIFLGQNNGNSKVMSFSRSRARLYTTSKIKFDDVAGADEEKEEMAEIVDFLKNPAEAVEKQTGLKIDKKKIVLDEPVKMTGRKKVQVKLYPGISATLDVSVEAE